MRLQDQWRPRGDSNPRSGPTPIDRLADELTRRVWPAQTARHAARCGALCPDHGDPRDTSLAS